MLDKKSKLICKVIIAIFAIISIGIGTTSLVFMMTKTDVNDIPYFFKYFGIGVALMCLSVVAFLMPMIAQTKYQGAGKDGMMLIVAALLFLTGIISIIMEYMGIGFLG